MKPVLWIAGVILGVLPCEGERALERAPAHGDERDFFVPLLRLGALADGTKTAFRHRQVVFGAEAAVPTRIVDGVLKIEYRSDAILVEEVLLERIDGKRADPLRQVTHFSMVSGESARVSFRGSQPGECTVILEWWSALPALVWMGLGFVAGTDVSQAMAPGARESLPEGDSSVLLSGEAGALRLVWNAARGPGLRSVESSAPDGRPRTQAYFRDPIPWTSDGPWRPTLLTVGALGPEGQVVNSQVYRSIAGEWAERKIALAVPAGATVYDFRGSEGTARVSVLDRRTGLGDLLVRAPIDEGPGFDPNGRAPQETPDDTPPARGSELDLGADFGSWAGLVSAGAVAILLALRYKRRQG